MITSKLLFYVAKLLLKFENSKKIDFLVFQGSYSNLGLLCFPLFVREVVDFCVA